MLRRLSTRLTYSNIVATAALFLALGGTSYAAFRLPSNSVGSKQLKAHSVTPSKIAAASVAMFKGQKGATGLQGPSGPLGPQGPQGRFGPTFATSGTGSVSGFFSACQYVTLVSKTFTITQP